MSNEPYASSEYSDLVAALNSRLSTGHLGVEILPDIQSLPTGSHVQIVENTIGIPKKVLRKAFITAHQIFFRHLDDLEENVEAILDATSVILLFDPEHLTAANARKRIGLKYRTRSHSEQMQRLSDELWFTEFLLTSRLKRHNKSPTLWSHRKWIMKNFDTSKVMMTVEELDENEVRVVIPLSAENHPRNYYAWDYLRWWTTSRPQRGDINTLRSGMTTLVRFYQDWCLKHTSDTSGWSFLLWLLMSPSFYTVSGLQLQAEVGKKVLDCAMSMKLKNESLWLFLKGNMAYMQSTIKAGVRIEYIGALGKLTRTEPDGSKLRQFAEKDLHDIAIYENGGEMYWL
jgi:hypothetical protein